jgi:succinate-acetate transporter protein
MVQHAPQTGYQEEGNYGIANPRSLGLLALALTTGLIGATFARVFVPTIGIGFGTVTAAAAIYLGIVQILAGMWAFRRNHTFDATLFSVYGGFLIVLGVVFLPSFGLATLALTNILAFNHALGLLFLCWTITCAVLLVGSLRANMGLSIVVACLTLSYLFLMIGSFANANNVLLAIGGWIGIVCALIAWYEAMAWMLQATGSPIQLPMVGRRETALPSAHGYGGEPAV